MKSHIIYENKKKYLLTLRCWNKFAVKLRPGVEFALISGLALGGSISVGTLMKADKYTRHLDRNFL